MKKYLAVALPLFATALFAQKMTDQQFVERAGQINMVESHLGQMAQEKGGGQDVKDFGRELDTDHKANYDKLTKAAQGVEVPKAIDKAHNAEIAKFDKLSGAAFDRAFKQQMIAGHEQAIALFKRASTQLQSDSLKSYVTDTLPALQQHLDHAKSLGKAGAAGAK